MEKKTHHINKTRLISHSNQGTMFKTKSKMQQHKERELLKDHKELRINRSPGWFVNNPYKGNNPRKQNRFAKNNRLPLQSLGLNSNNRSNIWRSRYFIKWWWPCVCWTQLLPILILYIFKLFIYFIFHNEVIY